MGAHMLLSADFKMGRERLASHSMCCPHCQQAPIPEKTVSLTWGGTLKSRVAKGTHHLHDLLSGVSGSQAPCRLPAGLRPAVSRAAPATPFPASPRGRHPSVCRQRGKAGEPGWLCRGGSPFLYGNEEFRLMELNHL